MAGAWHFSNLRNIYYVGHEGPGEIMDFFFNTSYTFFFPSQINTERETNLHPNFRGLGMDVEAGSIFFFETVEVSLRLLTFYNVKNSLCTEFSLLLSLPMALSSSFLLYSVWTG